MRDLLIQWLRPTDHFHHFFFHLASRRNNQQSKSVRHAPYSKDKSQGVAPSDAQTDNNDESTSITREGSAPADDASGDSPSSAQETPGSLSP